MIKPANGREDSAVFASIYNSANTLFSQADRCEAGREIFYRQLTEDHNFVYVSGNDICGFISYHKFTDYDEITSLYVKRDYQRMGIGHQLLSFAESQIGEGNDIMIKVLKNADWALRFYQKYGYKRLKDIQNNTACNLIEKEWEKIYYKKNQISTF